MAITVFAVSACFAVFMWPTVVARMTISSSDEAVTLRIKYNDDAVASGVGQLWRVLDRRWYRQFHNMAGAVRYFDAVIHVSAAHNSSDDLFEADHQSASLPAWLALIIRTVAGALFTTGVRGVLVLLSAVLMIGLLDHFYWTLQQGRILWWSALALAAGRV